MSLNDKYIKIGHDIIGAAYEVRNNAGRGLREVYYEKALVYELTLRGYNVKTQVTIPVSYKGIVIDDAYKADIIVDDKVIIEIKAVGQLKETEPRQLLTYLKLTKLELGYLINFGVESFRPGKLSDPLPYNAGFYRIINNLY